jgi:hypothetical protein
MQKSKGQPKWKEKFALQIEDGSRSKIDSDHDAKSDLKTEKKMKYKEAKKKWISFEPDLNQRPKDGFCRIASTVLRSAAELSKDSRMRFVKTT